MSALLSLLPLLFPQVPTLDGAQVAGAAQAALLRAPEVTYRADLRRQLQVEQTGWVADGQVWLRRATGDEPGRLRIDGTVQALPIRAEAGEIQASLWVVGERWVFLDRGARVVTEGQGPGLAGEPSAALAALVPPGLLQGTAIDPRRDWGQAAQASFAGELCNVIETKAENHEERWLLGPDDLPRQRVTRTRVGGETIFATLRFQQFAPATKVGPGIFEVELPDGVESRAPVGVEAFPPRRASAARVVSLARGLDDFVAAFNAGQDRPRLVGLFGPT